GRYPTIAVCTGGTDRFLTAPIAPARAEQIARSTLATDAADRRPVFLGFLLLASIVFAQNPIPALVADFVCALERDIKLRRHPLHRRVASAILQRLNHQFFKYRGVAAMQDLLGDLP